MLRECIKHEPLAKLLLESESFYSFYTYVELSTFDIASDAFSTFKVFILSLYVYCVCVMMYYVLFVLCVMMYYVLLVLCVMMYYVLFVLCVMMYYVLFVFSVIRSC